MMWFTVTIDLIVFPVPCYKRVKQMDSHEEKNECVIEEEDGDGGWVDTHHYADKSVTQVADAVGEMSIDKVQST